jgi:hypothetical protein
MCRQATDETFFEKPVLFPSGIGHPQLRSSPILSGVGAHNLTITLFRGLLDPSFIFQPVCSQIPDTGPQEASTAARYRQRPAGLVKPAF